MIGLVDGLLVEGEFGFGWLVELGDIVVVLVVNGGIVVMVVVLEIYVL